MMIHTDLFEFAYIPDWYGQLDELQQMALPESWRFRKPMIETKNTDTPILERYIHTIFRKLSIDYNTASDNEEASKYFHIENEHACFHTGLYTQRFKAIYACFDRNKKSDTSLKWFFRGFCDDVSPLLNHIEPLPEKPNYISISKNGVNFNPEWHIRVNVDHILCDSENLERIPLKLRKAKNLPLLLETAVEIARRKAIEPALVVPQGYQSKLQYLLPIYLTNMEKPDLAMTLTVMDGYYLGNTCLTLEMAYLNARLIARPLAPWLASLVK